MRAGWVWIATFVIVSIVLAAAPVEWPLDDFVEYWAAGRLNADGVNPYDPAAVLREERRAGWQQPEPVMMYNPPWTLALAMLMGTVPLGTARSVWLPIQI